MRKLLKTLLSLLILAPAAALALGLGNVTLHSALNEPLNAEIELLSVAPGELDSLQVALADTQTFSRLGVERSSPLMFLRFGVEQKPSGEQVVRVSSTENMREPFLTFLVDARWSTGRLVREYTLLLDPPVSHQESAPATVAPVTAAPPRATTTPAAPTRPAVAPMSPRPGAAPAASPGDLVYGPVKNDDTLWRIAQQMRPGDDISVQQMMMALLKANPYAFIDGNINRLKAGYVLRIDDPRLLRAMSHAEAAREVARQTREWQDRRQAAAARATERASPEMADTPSAAVAVAPRSEPELKLVTPEGKAESPATGAAGDETVAAVRQDLMLALESSAAQRQENEELLKRIAAMEQQLTDMERMLNLKSSDLAVLQDQLREQGQEVELPSASAEPVAQEAVAEPSATAETATPTAESAAAPAQVEPRAEERPRRPVAPPPPPPEPGLLESLLADPIMLATGGGVLLVLLILIAMIIRRRRKGSFQESILSGGTSSMMTTKASETKETSFLSDLAISGMGAGAAGEEGEVDPLTEADVFMAYGRNQQAEEVLKKALVETPQRQELTAKLLEVYYNTRSVDEFAELAQDAADALKDNDEIWHKVVAMGYELQPDNALFAEAGERELPAISKPAAPLSDDVMDIGLDLDELSAEMEGEGEGSGELFDLGLDLTEDEKPETGDEAEPVGDMEFDLDLGNETEVSKEGSKKTEKPADLELDAGEIATEGEDDFSLDFETDASPVGDELDVSDMELGDLDLGELETESLEETSSVASDELNLDDLDALSTTEPMDDELGDLDEDMMDESDEATTKLDLAQAYIEMGDTEGARSMLEEVVEAGSEEQKQQAQALLDKI